MGGSLAPPQDVVASADGETPVALDWYQVPSIPQWPNQRRPWVVSAVFDPLPIPNAAAPTFSAYATYPAWVSTRSLSAASHLSWAAPVPSVVLFQPLAWKPTFPDQLFPATRLEPRQQLVSPFMMSSLLDVPIRGGWRPVAPDFARARPRLVPGQGLWNVDMTTILNAASCLEWANEALVNPSLTGQLLMNSDLDAEALRNPAFGSEDLC